MNQYILTKIPQVLKELPKNIEKRISNISSSKEIFDISKPIYEKTLNECEFQHKLLLPRKCD